MSFVKIFICFVIPLAMACRNDQNSTHNSAGNLSKEEVIAFLNTYDNAWNTKNNKVVDSLYAPQYRYFTSVGGVSSRARNLEILTANYYRVIAANRTEIDISIDGNIAIVSSRWQGNGVWMNEPFNDNQRCGLVIQKKGKELKLLSEHCVDISTEPSF
ncbi:MAG TPA: nuclear transport factor 2 family protein [Flavitalea sp.]|nr:nuclear transport factor 2 family protein [Flavitalea sp.]